MYLGLEKPPFTPEPNIFDSVQEVKAPADCYILKKLISWLGEGTAVAFDFHFPFPFFCSVHDISPSFRFYFLFILHIPLSNTSIVFDTLLEFGVCRIFSGTNESSSKRRRQITVLVLLFLVAWAASKLIKLKLVH
jgi:hypothetical protein